jgi:hypothetical protein
MLLVSFLLFFKIARKCVQVEVEIYFGCLNISLCNISREEAVKIKMNFFDQIKSLFDAELYEDVKILV